MWHTEKHTERKWIQSTLLITHTAGQPVHTRQIILLLKIKLDRLPWHSNNGSSKRALCLHIFFVFILSVRLPVTLLLPTSKFANNGGISVFKGVYKKVLTKGFNLVFQNFQNKKCETKRPIKLSKNYVSK